MSYKKYKVGDAVSFVGEVVHVGKNWMYIKFNDIGPAIAFSNRKVRCTGCFKCKPDTVQKRIVVEGK